jgi:hypothetical protein
MCFKKNAENTQSIRSIVLVPASPFDGITFQKCLFHVENRFWKIIQRYLVYPAKALASGCL